MDGRELRRSEFMFVDRPWLGCQTLVRRRHTVGSSSGSGVRVLARRPLPALAGPSAHELRVALGTRYYDIHPDPHGLRGRGHHVVQAVVGFHTEGQRWVWTLGDHGRQKGGRFRPKTAPVAPSSSETFRQNNRRRAAQSSSAGRLNHGSQHL